MIKMCQRSEEINSASVLLIRGANKTLLQTDPVSTRGTWLIEALTRAEDTSRQKCNFTRTKGQRYQRGVSTSPCLTLNKLNATNGFASVPGDEDRPERKEFRINSTVPRSPTKHRGN